MSQTKKIQGKIFRGENGGIDTTPSRSSTDPNLKIQIPKPTLAQPAPAPLRRLRWLWRPRQCAFNQVSSRSPRWPCAVHLQGILRCDFCDRVSPHTAPEDQQRPLLLGPQRTQKVQATPAAGHDCAASRDLSRHRLLQPPLFPPRPPRVPSRLAIRHAASCATTAPRGQLRIRYVSANISRSLSGSSSPAQRGRLARPVLQP